MSTFKEEFRRAQKKVHQIAKTKGWWEHNRNLGELIALMHSELSEALEYMRHGNPASDHIQDFSGVEEEFADVIIRIMDLSQEQDYDVAGAIEAKIEFNKWALKTTLHDDAIRFALETDSLDTDAEEE